MSWICVQRFPIEQDLQALSRQLHQENIAHRFSEEAGEQCLWVGDESSAKSALQVIEYVSKHGMSQSNHAPGQATPRVDWKRYCSMFSLTLITIFFGLLGFLITEFGSSFDLPKLYGVFTLVPIGWYREAREPLTYLLNSHEYWRLLTPTFLHFGIWHVMFNCMGILEVGRRIELYLKRSQYLILFLFLAISSNIIQLYVGQSGNFGGLSGVLCGYFGFVWMVQRLAPTPILYMPKGLYIWIVAWIVAGMLGIFEYLFSIHIANASHVSGLVLGLLAGLIYMKLWGTARSQQLNAHFEKINAQKPPKNFQ